VGLPALRFGRTAAPSAPDAARVQCFFALLAVVDDTNLLHRGGAEGLAGARMAAASFLTAGGVGAPGWLDRAVGIHRDFVAARLSPGGCADLLAATLFLDALAAVF
jgi:triphosphoribosyl-dephospho-CoA synthase